MAPSFFINIYGGNVKRIKSILLFLLLVVTSSTLGGNSVSSEIPIMAPEAELSRIVIIHSYDLDYYESTFLDNMIRPVFLNSENRKWEIKKFFLKAHVDESDIERRSRAERMWRTAMGFNPDHVLIFGNEAYESLEDNIVEFSQKNKIGIFDVYGSDELLHNLGTKKFSHIFASYYKIDVELFEEYAEQNGIEINDYYIIRDTSRFHLSIAKEIKSLLHNLNPRIEVHEQVVHNIQDLRSAITAIQLNVKGVFIPLVNSLYNVETKRRESFSEVLTEIRIEGIRQPELFVTAPVSEYGMSISLYHIHNECHNLNEERNFVDYFIKEFSGDNRILVELNSTIDVNDSRLERLGANKFLHNLSLVHCLREF
jgi:hypothetical protein